MQIGPRAKALLSSLIVAAFLGAALGIVIFFYRQPIGLCAAMLIGMSFFFLVWFFAALYQIFYLDRL